jgi:hypothetical protein
MISFDFVLFKICLGFMKNSSRTRYILILIYLNYLKFYLEFVWDVFRIYFEIIWNSFGMYLECIWNLFGMYYVFIRH